MRTIGGTGTGDITAVRTAANSGFSGGADSGDVDLILDVANLVGQTNVAGADHLPFDDTSASVSKRITMQNFAAHLFPTSGGLAPTTSGQGHLRIHGLPGFTTFEGSDEFGLTDDSTSDNVSKKATFANVAGHLAGDNLAATSDGIVNFDDPDRLCPDPSGGSAGDVCTRNTAGDAYELTSAGSSTDDQTAAEVPVTTTNFDGNLSSTDDDVQTALETLDDLSVGGGGGGGTSVDAVDVQFITNTRSIQR